MDSEERKAAPAQAASAGEENKPAETPQNGGPTDGEEKLPRDGKPEKPAAEPLHSQQSGKKKNKSRPVTHYLTILFAVAFLLLLMSFFMQQRNHEAIMNLNSSVDNAQTVTDLELAKQQLEFKLETNQKDLDQAKTENETLSQQLDDQKKATQALDWLRQIEAAYRQGTYSTARQLLSQFQAANLTGDLPDDSVVAGGTSPAQSYQNLVKALT